MSVPNAGQDERARSYKGLPGHRARGISEKLLEWKGMEATMELVKRQNAKVIVVGNSKNGLPLVYSGDR